MRRLARCAAVVALLAASFALQARFLAAYPQPIVFGDPAGYYKVGNAFLEAVRALAAGEPAAQVLGSIRGYAYLAGVGAFFAALEALRPGDFAFFRLVLAGFNTLAALGCFLLARRLAGSWAAGLVALVVWLLHPSFPTQIGRLYPDPVTACLFVWSAWLYLEGLARGRGRLLAGAGLVFGAALLIRSQLMDYMLLVLALALAVSLPWWRRAASRRQVAALVLGLLPAIAAWGALRAAAAGRDDVVQLGNLTFRPAYPFGFWQFYETDGWIGPYRLRSEPYYRALEAAAAEDPALRRSRARQWLFTLGYVAERPLRSLGLVLDNAYRLYDRPANDYKWDYPIPYAAQLGLQRGIVVLGVVGVALAAAGAPASLGAFLVPLALAVLHRLVFPWPRYNQPALPLLIAAAAAAPWLAARSRHRPGRPALARLAALGAAALVLLALAAALLAPLPEVSRVASALGWLLVVAAPFAAALAWRPSARGWLALGCAAVAVPAAAHRLRDRLWHEFAAPLGGRVAGVEQRILLSPEALGELRAASEAFVMLDLLLPRGVPHGLRLEIGGSALPGSALEHTMPRLREATAAGGRDRRGYPQWWALPLDPRWLPRHATEPLVIRLLAAADAQAVIRGDRFADQQRVYEGPSFGEWPTAVPLKIEYDADYRIAVRRPLRSLATRSTLVERGGGRRELPGVLRIRLITLAQNQGELLWESPRTPASPRLSLAFAAYSAEAGEARLEVAGVGSLALPLAPTGDYVRAEPPLELCYRYLENRGDKAFGVYVLAAPNPAPGDPLALAVRFRTGMTDRPRLFNLAPGTEPALLEAALEACGAPAVGRLPGVGRVVDATRNDYPVDTGRWTVAGVY